MGKRWERPPMQLFSGNVLAIQSKKGMSLPEIIELGTQERLDLSCLDQDAAFEETGTKVRHEYIE